MSMIKVKMLTKYFNGLTAVNNISFEVKKGDIFAFLGPNGAGKTTTIKMLTTLLTPDKGMVKLNGIDTVKEPDRARETFGIVFQDPSLDEELTAWENLEFHGVLYGVSKNERRKRIKELMTFVDLWKRKDDLVGTFSGGMRRRLEIARGFLHHPNIFFLDEPTLGLDPQTRKNIWDHVAKLNKENKMTIFFTTHYMEEAEKHAKKIAIIDKGKIIAIGTPEKLKGQTRKNSLEDAFIELTGYQIREEQASSKDRMRQRRKLWGRRR
jgi:ABC-2 type transport system ATP-binding protein